jgi:hypothetical protein
MVCTSGLGGCTVATGFSSCNEDGAAVRMTFLCLCRWLPSSLTEHLRNTPVLNSWTTHSALRTHCGGSQFITITLQRLCLPHVRHGDRIFHNPLLVINLIVKGPGLILFLIPSSPDLGAFSFHYLPQPPPKKKRLVGKHIKYVTWYWRIVYFYSFWTWIVPMRCIWKLILFIHLFYCHSPITWNSHFEQPAKLCVPLPGCEPPR